MEKVILLLLLAFSIAAVQTHKMNRAVVYFASFSLIISLVYLIYSAPDVAIAQAVIGSTLSTVLYFVALAKYNVFRIYCNNVKQDNIFELIDDYCILHELEPSYIKKKLSNYFSKRYRFDLIIEQKNDEIVILGNKRNHHIEGLEKYICDNSKDIKTEKCKIRKY